MRRSSVHGEITNAKQARSLIGRKIVKIDLNRFDTGQAYTGRDMSSDPEIHLDDGRSIVFVVAETDGGDHYGIDIIVKDREPGS